MWHKPHSRAAGKCRTLRGAALEYFTTVTAVYAASIAAALPAWTHVPHPIAVMAIVGALTASAAAPFITPIRRQEEDT